MGVGWGDGVEARHANWAKQTSETEGRGKRNNNKDLSKRLERALTERTAPCSCLPFVPLAPSARSRLCGALPLPLPSPSVSPSPSPVAAPLPARAAASAASASTRPRSRSSLVVRVTEGCSCAAEGHDRETREGGREKRSERST